MSDAPATPPKLPAWALLTGATLLAVGTRVLIAVAERSAGFGQTKELTAASIAAAALAAAVGTYVGRRWINRPSGFLLGVALAGIAMLLLAGTSHVGVGLGVGLVMSGLVLWLRNPWRMAAAGVVALVAGAVTYFAVPVESAIIWGTLAGVLTFLLYGYRIPPREGRGLKTWIAFAGRTAAIALAAGLALWWGRLAPVRALIAKVQSSQGNVHFVDLPKPLRTFRKQLQTAGFVPVRGLGIYGPAVTTDLVASMGRLGSLEEVWIENAALDPEALTGLAAAPALKRLVLDKCQVSPTAWASLSQSFSLSHVALYHVTLGDEGLAALAHIPNLHWLSLEDAAVTHAGLVAFQNQPGLSTLFVTGPQVNADWLRELRHLPTITELRMSSWDRSPPAAHPTPAISPLRETGNSPELAAVRAAPNLKALHIHVPLDEDLRRSLIRETPNVLQLEMSRVGAFHPDPADIDGPLVQADLSYSGALTELPALLQPRPELRCVDVSGCELQPGDLAFLATLPNLETLVLDRARFPSGELGELGRAPRLAALSLRLLHTPLWSQALTQFAQMPALRELDLAYNGIADADLSGVRGLPTLRSLNLKGNPLTDAGLAQLVSLTALERLDLRETQVTAAGVQALQAKLPKVEIRWNAP
ncbi:MAG: hypothetical protein U0836_08725 [Pirellulales bacterium]